MVGGAARWLRGVHRVPRDLDVVVTPGQVPALVEALAGLGITASGQWLARAREAALRTGWGPLDVFVRTAAPAAMDVDGLAVARG